MSHLSAKEQELYTSLDEGLSAMSHHARDMGYDAVILFLDEFILWLASRSADAAWIAREGQKAAKLVESGNADRPVPIVSFMARQRDLRELVGDHMPGAEQLAFADTLQFWEARVDKVNLEDRNLPEIAKKRLLRTRGPAEDEQLKQAVRKLLGSQPQVLQTLLTREGDQQMLQDLYAFTPALVHTLIALSSMLQRERTALKLMQQMLVEKADTLEIGDVIPVGDLFDVIATGDEAFTQGIKLRFEQTKQFWRRRLLPMLETQHGVSAEDIEAGTADPKKALALQNDARLLKTLVLAALVPEVEALKNLTPMKLAALNHGTIRTPVPGSEAISVLTKLKRWAGQAGEIKIADDSPNPVVTVEIAKVDTDAIIANGLSFDTHGNRQAEVRQLIFEGLRLGDTATGLLPPELEIVWRGSLRRAEILFCNIREQSFETLKGREGIWRILIRTVAFGGGPGVPEDGVSTAMVARILIIEDEAALAETIRFALSNDQFRPECCLSGAEALTALAREPPDLILLNVGLPDVNGFDLFHRLCALTPASIIFLTARVEVIDRVVGLEIGADDYITKPFSPRELVARVRTVLRRVNRDALLVPDSDSQETPPGREANDGPLPFGLDPEKIRITYWDAPLDLNAVLIRPMAVKMAAMLLKTLIFLFWRRESWHRS